MRRVRLPRWTEPAIDWLIVLVLVGGAQYQIWVQPLDQRLQGSQVANAVLFLLMVVPLGWRRRAPLLVLAIVLGSTVVGFYALYDPAWILDRALRHRQDLAATLAHRAARLEHDQEAKARSAVAEERSRIARELHDVIAHSLSVIVIQAAAERRVLGEEHTTTREVLGSIEHTGRQALVELRRLLGVIRKTDDRPTLAPQPTLAHLDELLEQVRETGLMVELRTEGEPVPLPPGVDLSAYRIIQEALTNVLKHADASHAEVLVCYHPGELELEVNDDGRGPTDRPGGGHGLVGMRERVALYGGVLEAGRRDGGGYRLHARLRFEPVPA